MSRIGRHPVAIPAGVTVEIAENNVVTVTGPKGTLVRELPVEMEIKKEKAILAGLSADVMPEDERSTETSMEELAALVETAGGEALVSLLQSRPAPDPRCFLEIGRASCRERV